MLFVLDFIKIKLVDIIDILLVAVLIYQLYRLLKGTAAMKIFAGIIAVFFIWKIVNAIEMELLSEILGKFVSVGVIALVVVFQPEIRKFLLLLGTPNFIRNRKYMFWKILDEEQERIDIDSIVQACRKMASDYTGALIVISNSNDLEEYVNSGEVIDARISWELMQNIFFKNSPLHDGAVIIHRNRLKAARCILPVSANFDLPSDLGLRHRSALGITENTDAIAIVVSEQNGFISYCKEGILTRNVQPSQLKSFLEAEFLIN